MSDPSENTTDPSFTQSSRPGGGHTSDLDNGAGLLNKEQPVEKRIKEEENKSESVGDKVKDKLGSLTSNNQLKG